MTMIRKITNWYMRTRLAYITLLYSRSEYRRGAEEHRRLLASTRFQDERVNNHYLGFCLARRRLELIDEFVERFTDLKLNQNLPVFIGIFQLLEEMPDFNRLVRYAPVGGSLGAPVARSLRERAWYQDYEINQDRYARENGRGNSSPLERQLEVSNLIQLGKLDAARTLLKPTLFHRFTDSNFNEMRVRNSERLFELKDPVILAFLEYQKTTIQSERSAPDALHARLRDLLVLGREGALLALLPVGLVEGGHELEVGRVARVRPRSDVRERR